MPGQFPRLAAVDEWWFDHRGKVLQDMPALMHVDDPRHFAAQGCSKDSRRDVLLVLPVQELHVFA